MDKKLSKHANVLISCILFFAILLIAFYPSTISAYNTDTSIKINKNSSLSENKTILLTGFGPFDIYEENPSQIIVEELNGSIINNYSIISWVLPVNFTTVSPIIKSLITDYKPDLILMLGLAPNASAIRLETLAINMQYDPYIPNPYLHLKRIDKQGPFFIRSTLDIMTSYYLIREKKIPVEISFSAGWYLCNTVFYETNLFIKQQQLDIPAGFVHIPRFIQDNPNGLPMESMIESILLIIQAQHK